MFCGAEQCVNYDSSAKSRDKSSATDIRGRFSLKSKYTEGHFWHLRRKTNLFSWDLFNTPIKALFVPCPPLNLVMVEKCILFLSVHIHLLCVNKSRSFHKGL